MANYFPLLRLYLYTLPNSFGFLVWLSGTGTLPSLAWGIGIFSLILMLVFTPQTLEVFSHIYWLVFCWILRVNHLQIFAVLFLCRSLWHVVLWILVVFLVLRTVEGKRLLPLSCAIAWKQLLATTGSTRFLSCFSRITLCSVF